MMLWVVVDEPSDGFAESRGVFKGVFDNLKDALELRRKQGSYRIITAEMNVQYLWQNGWADHG